MSQRLVTVPATPYTSAPGVNDDTHLGFVTGCSFVIDVTHGNAYFCTSAALGAATWVTLGNAGGSTSITTVGTITIGTWHATPIGSAYGGTGGDSSAVTGIAHVAAGVWSYSTIATADIAANAVTSAKVDSSVIIASGANAFTGNQAMGGFKLTGLGNATVGTDAANLQTVVAQIVALAQLPLSGAASTLFGVGSGGAGAIHTITLGSGLSMTGNVLSATSGSGTVTSIIAGAGLTGGTITVSGTVAIDYTQTPTWTGTHSYLQTVGTTVTDALHLENTTAASLGSQQYSPALHFSGQGWATGGSTSQSVDYYLLAQPAQGASATGALIIYRQLNGGALNVSAQFFSDGSASIGAGGPGGPIGNGIFNAGMGIRINNSAASAHYLRGNGTNYVDSALLAADLTGTVAIANGGTNSSTALTNGYLIVSNSGAIVGASAATGGSWSANSNKLTSVTDPTNPQDAATKNYVDLAVAAIAAKNDCAAATTTALAASTYNNGSAGVGATITLTVAAVLVLDGYTPALNDRLLIKNQASAVQNGLYAVTTLGVLGVTQAVLTRTTDFDQPGDGINGALVFVLNGTTNGNTLWSCTTAASVTFGTTNINWSQFTGTTYTADETTLHLAGTTFSIISTYTGQTSITTLGTITTGVWNGTAIANANLAHSSITIASSTLTGTGAVSLGGTATLNVNYGFTSNTALQGNTTLDQIAPPAANVAMAGFKMTGMGNATVATDSSTLANVWSALSYSQLGF
jgi:hypothetical protein